MSTNSVNFQWTAVTAATAYALRVGTSCGATDILSVDPTVANYSASNLPNGTYFWRVQAYKETCPGVSLASGCYSFTINVQLLPDIDVSPTVLAFTCTGSTAAPIANRAQLLRPRPTVIKPARTIVDDRFQKDMITVKFRDGLHVRLRNGALTDENTGALAWAANTLRSLTGGKWERTHSLPEDKLDQLRAIAQQNSVGLLLI